MVTNHKEFIEAIRDKKKVWLRFYSKADSQVIDLVCAPLTVAARTLGGQARWPEIAPANKK